jgi:hypothetical protein
MSHALILRPKDTPVIRVLEVDGPRQKYHRRGEGFYYLATNNHQRVEGSFYWFDQPPEPHLKGHDEPCWEIIQNHDRTIEIHANRPTIQEVYRGDLHGRWGSVIKLNGHGAGFFGHIGMRVALRIARMLCQCIPTQGITVRRHWLTPIALIETDIPISLAD